MAEQELPIVDETQAIEEDAPLTEEQKSGSRSSSRRKKAR